MIPIFYFHIKLYSEIDYSISTSMTPLNLHSQYFCQLIHFRDMLSRNHYPVWFRLFSFLFFLTLFKQRQVVTCRKTKYLFWWIITQIISWSKYTNFLFYCPNVQSLFGLHWVLSCQSNPVVLLPFVIKTALCRPCNPPFFFSWKTVL